jgi:hypothetical protein
MEQWRAEDALNGGLKAQNGALEGLSTSGCRFIVLLWDLSEAYGSGRPTEVGLG